jgi:asparagine synthase (glutamine-hydrolysing)
MSFWGGYPSFKQIPALVQRLKHLHGVSNTVGRTARMLSAGWLGKLTSSKYAGLLEYGTSYTGAYLLRRSVFMPWELGKHLPTEIIQEGLPQVLEALRNAAPFSRLSDKGKVSVLESTLYMRNQLLRDSDWASMAHSIELRVPLVDIEVLAASSKATKNLLSKTPKHPLIERIVNRQKTGFLTPIQQWMKIEKERGLRGWLKHIHKESSLEI